MPYDDKPLSYFSSAETDTVMDDLATSEKGLTKIEAELRLRTYGLNLLAVIKNSNLVVEFISHFKNPLIIILLVASIFSIIVHEAIDAAIILIIVVMSVFLDFYLEHNAEKAAEKLKESVKTKVIVVRDGEKKEIKAENLCVGDVIILNAGSLVPADARIINAKDFFLNQSALTGESYPCQKTVSRLISKDFALTELSNMVFQGTNVVSGTATAVVIKTGVQTEFGKIAATLVLKEEETEFDRGIRSFGYLIMKATVFLVLFIFLFNSIVKHNIFESFMFALAVAVGLTPELLPIIMSITMAQGSLKMAEKGVIVKKLTSIPNFGSMDVLCTDKTGTLTEDKIKLVKYTDFSGRESSNVLRNAYLNSYHQTGIKNPLDQAVLEFKEIKVTGFTKIDEIPFDFARKMMSVVVEKSGKRHLITKGAPEEVFKSSTYYSLNGKKLRLTLQALEKIKREYFEFSRQGYRVLAVASKVISKKDKSYTKEDESNLELLGFVSFLDPPKADVREVLKELNSVGVEVKIITGDNELVTKKICDEIQLEVKGILLGVDIVSLSDDALRVKVEKTTIFARFSPDQKNRIIHALRSNGHVVGYMGDGINDAPSLKSADIGISVNSGVDVAKESAHIILTRKSLKELKEGILEGRKTFASTIKYVMMGVSSNFGNMFSVAAAVLFLPFLPMLPIQILLNNFIYDFSQITIPSDNVDQEFIQKPKRWNIGFIQKFMIVFGPISSIFDIITFLVLYKLFKVPPGVFQTGWFMESLATQTLVIHIIRTKKIAFLQSIASAKLIISSILCVGVGWLLPFTPIGKFFGFEPLPLNILIFITGLVQGYLFTVELAKRVFYKKFDF